MERAARTGNRSTGARAFRLVALLAIAAISIGALGCGDDDDDGGAATEPTTAETTTEETTTEEAGGGGATGDAGAGQQVFADTCSTCHGPNGEGGTAPSLQDSDVAANFDQVVDQVTNGGGGMPAFGDQLSEQQINDVAAYVTEEIAGSS